MLVDVDATERRLDKVAQVQDTRLVSEASSQISAIWRIANAEGLHKMLARRQEKDGMSNKGELGQDEKSKRKQEDKEKKVDETKRRGTMFVVCQQPYLLGRLTIGFSLGNLHRDE